MSCQIVRAVPFRLAAGAVAAGLLLASCGGDDDGGGGGSDSGDLADSFASAAVCNGEPSDVNPPSTDPFAGYSYLDDGTGWSVGWNVFGDQRAIVGDDATRILCVTVTESTEVERCDYEEDGEAFTLVMASATFDTELRDADTADVVASETFTLDAEPCPTVVSWTPGEGERTDYPVPSDEEIEAAFGESLG